jgi:CRISPR-associated protein Cas2
VSVLRDPQKPNKRHSFFRPATRRLNKGLGEYAVVYDISSERERRHISKILKGFGFRVQKSVFECRLDRRLKTELLSQLEAAAPETGFVKIYRLEYSSKNETFGKAATETLDSGYAFIV